MRMTPLLAAAVCVAALAGCGSTGTSSDTLRHAIGDLKTAIQTYNHTPQADIVATSAGCSRAHAALARNSTLLNPGSGSDSLDTDLRNAYQHALAGFAECAAAAPYDYQRMLQAQDELSSANDWLARARTVA